MKTYESGQTSDGDRHFDLDSEAVTGLGKNEIQKH